MEEENKIPQTLQKEEPRTPPDIRQTAFPTRSATHSLPIKFPRWAAMILLLLIFIVILYGLFSTFIQKDEYLTSNSPTPQPTQPQSNNDPTTNWKTYSNKDLGFSIRYPQNMQLDESIIKPTNIEDPTCITTLKNVEENNLLTISICYFDNPKELSLQNLDNSLSRPTDVDGITSPRLSESANEDTTLRSGLKAYYQKEHSCHPVNCPRYIIVHDKKVFVIKGFRNQGWSYKSNYNNTFDQILSTFKFIESATPINTGEYKIYDTNKISISYPSSWIVDKNNEANRIISFYHKINEYESDYSIEFDFYNRWENDHGNKVYTKSITWLDHPATMVLGAYEKNHLYITTNLDGKDYSITMWGPSQKDLEENTELFLKIAKSVKLK